MPSWIATHRERVRGHPEAEATMQRQRGLVLPDAAAFTDLVCKHLAIIRYLSALGTAVEAHDLARAGGRRITSGWPIHPDLTLLCGNAGPVVRH